MLKNEKGEGRKSGRKKRSRKKEAHLSHASDFSLPSQTEVKKKKTKDIAKYINLIGFILFPMKPTGCYSGY